MKGKRRRKVIRVQPDADPKYRQLDNDNARVETSLDRRHLKQVPHHRIHREVVIRAARMRMKKRSTTTRPAAIGRPK